MPEYFVELPRDPFVDRPLRYQRTDDTYLLYSVGKNMQDDSGRGAEDPDQPGDDWSTTVTWQDWNKIRQQVRDRWNPTVPFNEDSEFESDDECTGELEPSSDKQLSSQ